MTCKVSSVTYENRQQLLRYISGQKKENLTVYRRGDRANTLKWEEYSSSYIKNTKFFWGQINANGAINGIDGVRDDDINIADKVLGNCRKTADKWIGTVGLQIWTGFWTNIIMGGNIAITD